jgi:hypothetical protein
MGFRIIHGDFGMGCTTTDTFLLLKITISAPVIRIVLATLTIHRNSGYHEVER